MLRVQVLRFENVAVLANPGIVLEAISAVCSSAMDPSPFPSPRAAGRGKESSEDSSFFLSGAAHRRSGPHFSSAWFRTRALGDGPKAALIRVSPFGGLIGTFATLIDNGTNDATLLTAGLAAK